MSARKAKPPVTLKAIARQLQVSESTVSRVLSGNGKKYRISAKTEKAVLELARKWRFVPNPLAQGLRLNRTQTIGLIIPDISNPFFARVARQIEVEARQAGFSIILCDSEEDTSLEIKSLELLEARKVDGFLIAPVGETTDHLQEYARRDWPMVIVDRYLPEIKLPYVSSDNFKGTYQAVKYLLERGHRRIACVQGRTASLPNRERVRGYRQALQEYQVAIDESLLVGNDFGLENGYIKTKLLLRQEKKFTAIMALSNLICLGTIRALTEEGMEIPRDISLIGFDDQVYCEYLRTPVTTVAQNEKEIGSIATKLLIEWIQQGEKPGSEGLMIPTRLVERASVQSVNPV